MWSLGFLNWETEGNISLILIVILQSFLSSQSICFYFQNILSFDTLVIEVVGLSSTVCQGEKVRRLVLFLDIFCWLRLIFYFVIFINIFLRLFTLYLLTLFFNDVTKAPIFLFSDVCVLILLSTQWTTFNFLKFLKFLQTFPKSHIFRN